MPKKKNQNYRLSISKELVKTFLVILIIGGVIWIWQNLKSNSKHTSKKQSKEMTQEQTQTEETTSTSVNNLSSLFPKQTWLDDYFQVKINSSPSEEILLVGIGTAPTGTNPEEVKNPETLNPELLIVKKNEKGYSKIDDFNFSTNQPTQSGINGNSLKGLPRFTQKGLINLDRRGEPEFTIFFDSAGKWTEAVALLKIENGKLNWIKTKDKKGNEKIALWVTGSTAAEAQKIIPQETTILQKIGRLDSAHPEKGFQWKTITWEYKNGMLRER